MPRRDHLVFPLALSLLLASTTARAVLPDSVARGLAAAVARDDAQAIVLQAELIARGELAGERRPALATLADAAAAGDAHAAFVLATLADDAATALAWYRVAAEAGDAAARFNLGLVLLEREPAAAEVLWQAAAAQHHVLACYALGTRHAAAAPARARPLLECAARQDYAPAQYNLATLLARGEGGRVDVEGARELYAAAAARFAPARAARDTLAAIAPSRPLALHDANWVLAQPAEAYTVQIAAGASAAVLQGMLAGTALGGDAACVLERPDSRQPWSALLGVFPERATAQQALETLPPTLRANAPWIRRFASVQAALRSASGSQRPADGAN